jgi:hypothetical protein
LSELEGGGGGGLVTHGAWSSSMWSEVLSVVEEREVVERARLSVWLEEIYSRLCCAELCCARRHQR